MAEVSAKDAMKLRQMTGAGVMDCKKALAEAVNIAKELINVSLESMGDS